MIHITAIARRISSAAHNWWIIKSRRPPTARLVFLGVTAIFAIGIAYEGAARLRNQAIPTSSVDRLVSDIAAGHVHSIVYGTDGIDAFAIDPSISTTAQLDFIEDTYAPSVRHPEIPYAVFKYRVHWPAGIPANQHPLLEHITHTARTHQCSEYGAQREQPSWLNTIGTITAIALVAFLAWLYMPVLRSSGRYIEKGSTNITLRDIAGLKEAKNDIADIINYLVNPQQYTALGASVPKGMILYGPPGTGKTMLAKAIANEANASFFAASGSDFVEMYVGLGARRIRQLFQKASIWEPSVIFIDEIDAIGKKRGSSGNHGETEQTLQALLTCLDGIISRRLTIVIAATNRIDDLDPALLRPGRFDRRIYVGLPDVTERLDILKIHSTRIAISPHINWTPIAQATAGYSGADLKQLINEAACIAARHRKAIVDAHDIASALDRMTLGNARSVTLTPTDKAHISIHEAGHAIIHLALAKRGLADDILHRVTIIPRGQSMGATVINPQHDMYMLTWPRAKAKLITTLAGYVAERELLGSASSGAQDDIRTFQTIAHQCIAIYAIAPHSTPQALGKPPDHPHVSDAIATLWNDTLRDTTSLVSEHRDAIEATAQALRQSETLTDKQVRALFDQYTQHHH